MHINLDDELVAAEAMRHWTGNEIRLRLRDAAQAAPAHEDELAAAPWRLLAGRRIAGVECNEPAATPTLEATSGHHGAATLIQPHRPPQLGKR
jgi:hypothetical protein